MFNFFIFFIYLTISIVIYGIIGVVIYKFFIKKNVDDNNLNFADLLNTVSNVSNNINSFDKDFWSDREDFKFKKESKNDEVYSSFKR